MNKYLKNRFAKYILALKNDYNYNGYDYDEFLDEITSIYKLEVKREFQEIERNSDRKERTKALYNDTEAIIKELKKKFNENENINCKLKNKIENICQIYNLDEKESNLVEYLILKKMDTRIRDLTDHLHSGREYYSPSKIIGTDDWIYDNLVVRLQNKGLISKSDKDEINSNLIKIIINSKIRTKTQITKELIGTVKKTDLKTEDYSFFEKEQKIMENILKAAGKNKTKGINILLYGGVGTGKTQFAKLIAQNSKINMYEVEFPITDEEERSRFMRIQDLQSKQEILSKSENTCILFDEAEDIMNQFTSSTKAYFNNLLEKSPVPVIWTTNNIYDVDPAFLRRMTYTLEFRKLSEEERLVVWKNVLKKNKFKVTQQKIEELNRDYDIAPSLISNAIKTTKLINGTEDDFETFIENVAQVVCKKKNVKNKKEFEFKGYNDNLVNTDLDTKKLTQQIKNCKKLNFSLCLYGEPGTGKSLYARYLAKELGIEVVFKRASDLISPYVGETEQNIARAFSEAKSKKAMLIFDEADTFLQNRNNAVRSWEVAQVNEMLTWMESHEYPFVCTTNLLETLDEASLRRFTFKIKFDFLTKEQVNEAIKHFFNIENTNVNINGLTAGDFATVKKKADFLEISDINEITNMLYEEVKLKQSKELKCRIGF